VENRTFDQVPIFSKAKLPDVAFVWQVDIASFAHDAFLVNYNTAANPFACLGLIKTSYEISLVAVQEAS
jgi:hypothetical protein